MTIDQHASQGIRDEHCHLRELLDSVRETIAARRTSRDTMIALLDDLTKEISGHFDHEESGGYFSDVIDIAPRLSERADQLLEQHPQLAEQLAAIHQHAEAQKPDDCWWLELEERFAEFMEHFQRHEAAENALLQDAYNDDIGAED